TNDADVWTTAGRADRRDDTGTSGRRREGRTDATTPGRPDDGGKGGPTRRHRDVTDDIRNPTRWDNIEMTPRRVDRQCDDTGTSRTTSRRPILTRRRQHRNARTTPVTADA